VIDIIGIRSPELVQRLRDRIQDAMLDLERQRHSCGNGNAIFADQRRVCSLLMLLPALTHVTLLARDFWRSVRASGRITLHKLLSEMLEFLNV